MQISTCILTKIHLNKADYCYFSWNFLKSLNCIVKELIIRCSSPKYPNLISECNQAIHFIPFYLLNTLMKVVSPHKNLHIGCAIDLLSIFTR